MDYFEIFESHCFMGVDRGVKGYDDITAEKLDDFMSLTDAVGGWRVGDEEIIGFNVDDMKEDETKKAFRHRVFEALKLVGYTGKEESVDWRLASCEFEVAE